MTDLAALVDGQDAVRAFVAYNPTGMYYRDAGDWLFLDDSPESEELVGSWDGFEAVPTDTRFTPRWDMSELSGAKLRRNDVPALS
jgi:hypothetical protein